MGGSANAAAVSVVRNRTLESSVIALKLFLRAFTLGYVSSIGPRSASILWGCIRKRLSIIESFQLLLNVFNGALALNKFPVFCGVLIGGSSALQPPFRKLLQWLPRILRTPSLSGRARYRISRFLSALVAALLSFQLLNSGPNVRYREEAIRQSGNVAIEEKDSLNVKKSESFELKRIPLAGKTIDLTLFAATRALDIIVGEMWSRRRKRRIAQRKWTQIEELTGRFTDAGIFALSGGMVMWAWFYLTERLPRAYNRWIREAAQVDQRLVEALRRARKGVFLYGADTGQAPLLQGMCTDYQWPRQWGDPTQTIPIPCEMVHMGTGASCEKHALERFRKAFLFALQMYLPLNLLMRAKSPSLKAFKHAVKDSTRSSAFLGGFIALFYYSVCASRTRFGPKLFGAKISPQMWDSGLCIRAGCIMCGWSILIEARRRHQEMAFFVAPRAAAILVPRKYDRDYIWREQLAFAASSAVIFTCIQENPTRVRGVLGRLLDQIFNTP